MKIAIIGGGFTSLTAGFLLSKKGHQVTIFEKEASLGGLVSSFKQDGWGWPLERFYHHFFFSNKEVVRLLTELGIKNKLFFKKPITSVFVNNQIYRFDSLQSILAFPKLTLFDKIRTSLVAGLMKINPLWQPLEKISAYSFIKKTMGQRNFDLIWKPLLESKFGSYAATVPASWFWTRIKKRSFKLGYLEGGIETLIAVLSEQIKKNQGEIFINNWVTDIGRDQDRFEISIDHHKLPEKFDQVIANLPPESLGKILKDLSQAEKEKLSNLKSLGAVVLVLELKKSFLTDGTYWLNINDSSFPFVAVVEHTNFIDKKYYNDHVILYVGGYYPITHPFFKMTKEQLLQKFFPYLRKVNPSYNFELCTLHFELFKAPYTQPIPSINYSQHSLPSTSTSIPGLYWASLHHVYPQDRGINYAIALGKKIAKEIEK